MELCDHPAYELSLLLRQKRIRAVEIVESCLQRIEAVDGRSGRFRPGEITDEDRERVHAFITVTAQRALAQARAVDENWPPARTLVRWRAFLSRSKIFSVCAVRPLRRLAHAPNYVAPYTATAVERLENAGE
jgi:aspartyl-tRNA(Asn)/glutamyl-tRNA(Gln) amidotransferase subunit A